MGLSQSLLRGLTGKGMPPCPEAVLVWVSDWATVSGVSMLLRTCMDREELKDPNTKN